MAKKKTEKASPFVPVEEYPYQVPENWCWVYIKSLASFVSKGTTPKGGKTAYHDNGIPFLRVENIKDDGTISMEGIKFVTEEEHNNFLKRSQLYVGDVLVSIAGTLGKTTIVTENCVPMNTNQAIAFIRLSNKSANPKFLRLAIDVPALNNLLLSKTKVTSIPNLTLEIIQNLPVPLPPLAEQQRIVDRIESLFAKLDEAKEKAQEALESFEARRSAILRSAFSGKLTESWRKEHGKAFCWKYVRFDEVAYIRSNLVEPAEYRKMPHIAPDNIEKKTGKLLEYHTIEEDGVTSGKHHFFPGQILYSKIRPYLSKVVLVGFEGLCSADMYPIEAVGNTKFLWYQMLSDGFLVQASSARSRSVLPKINQKELSALKVSVTSDKYEEAEMVRILDDFFAKETEAKEKVEVALNVIETMKKSILSKAFRGELGTNNPEDESAEEFLKYT